jgi:hypothetical protein
MNIQPGQAFDEFQFHPVESGSFQKFLCLGDADFTTLELQQYLVGLQFILLPQQPV